MDCVTCLSLYRRKNSRDNRLNPPAHRPVSFTPRRPTDCPPAAPMARTLETITMATLEAIFSIKVFTAEKMPSRLTPFSRESCWMMSESTLWAGC